MNTWQDYGHTVVVNKLNWYELSNKVSKLCGWYVRPVCVWYLVKMLLICGLQKFQVVSTVCDH